MAEADGSACIRETRGSGEQRVEFGARRQFNRYSDTSRFVVVAEAAGTARHGAARCISRAYMYIRPK